MRTQGHSLEKGSEGQGVAGHLHEANQRDSALPHVGRPTSGCVFSLPALFLLVSHMVKAPALLTLRSALLSLV